MPQFYKGKRTRNLYVPGDPKPFKLSRSRLEMFMECPRCFYMDRRQGVDRPPGFPFNLNSAVDALLKNEFDDYRASGETHPLLVQYGVDARPVDHPNLNVWRENFKGVQHLHESTNLMITGAIDDLWQNSRDEYMVVDYKSTSKDEHITALDKAWQDGYKRQMEVYQWLLRRNGLQVADTGYFVYCNGIRNKPDFNNQLEFETTLIAYEGDDRWVEPTIQKAFDCLQADSQPQPSWDCDYCRYRAEVDKLNSPGSD